MEEIEIVTEEEGDREGRWKRAYIREGLPRRVGFSPPCRK
jgi:hypothetical protein